MVQHDLSIRYWGSDPYSSRIEYIGIKEIDNQFVRMMRDSAIRPFQSISIPNYQLTNQLVDLNSKEEVVRQ